MLLRLFLKANTPFFQFFFFGGGTDVFDEESSQLDDHITSIAQDICYLVSKKKILTPKHIGLGLTLHQATRSEKLDLFHAAGYIIGMDTIRRLDTTIALDIIDRYNTDGHMFTSQMSLCHIPQRCQIFIY